MISNFAKGRKAASLGWGCSLCKLEGEARREWMDGYRSYKPEQQSVIINVHEISENFAKKHFKDELYEG